MRDRGLSVSRRFAALDAADANHDGFLHEDHAAGRITMASAGDPEPSIRINEGIVVELDGRTAAEFDLIDECLARHGLDLEVADEAMALEPPEIARMLSDIHAPREEIVRLGRGFTSAALGACRGAAATGGARVGADHDAGGKTPSNQAHVANQLDDPLLIAADAATAVAFGFRELETTVPVLGDAPCMPSPCSSAHRSPGRAR